MGSPQLVINSIRKPGSVPPLGLIIGWGPQGVVSTDRSRTSSAGWLTAAGPITPTSGWWRPTTPPSSASFGRIGSPPAELADAVAAACAIPGFYHPVKIGGRRYIDGGINSVSNLDLLADQALDLVICLNPMSSLHQPQNLGGRIAGLLRSGAGRRLVARPACCASVAPTWF